MSQVWVPPSYTDLRTAHFQANPFHCRDCGCDIDFKTPSFNHTINGRRVMLQGPSSAPLCGPCLGKRITAWFGIPLTGWHEQDRKDGFCDACGKSTTVATIIWDSHASSRFGLQWWNGWWICCDCLVETACKGRSESGHSASHNGKQVYLNEVGARIPPK